MTRLRLLLLFVAAFLVVTLVVGIAGSDRTDEGGSLGGRNGDATNADGGNGDGTGSGDGGDGAGDDDGARGGAGRSGEGGRGAGGEPDQAGGAGGGPAGPAPCPTGRIELSDPSAGVDGNVLVAQLSVRNDTDAPAVVEGAEVVVEDPDGRRYLVPVTGQRELAPGQSERWEGSGAFWPDGRGRPTVVSVETGRSGARWAARDDCDVPPVEVV